MSASPLLKLPTDLHRYLLTFLSSPELSYIDRTCTIFIEVARTLPFRSALPDGSYRRVIRHQTVSSGVSICQRINTRPERPRDYITYN